jgi:hypothetical protein
MEVVCPSETLVSTYKYTRRHNPEERHRLRVFENRVLRRIFGLKSDEVSGDWRKLHNKELYNSYCSPNIIRRMRWVGYVAPMGDRNAKGIGSLAGWCEHGNEPSGSVKDGECFDQMSQYQLFKEYSAPWSWCLSFI